MEGKYDEIIEELKSRGYKLTPQRMIVIKALLDLAPEHPSLKKLYERVKDRLPTMSFSTLYYTLLRLEGMSLVKMFDLNGETRVEVRVEPHINLIIAKEGKIMDVADDEILRIISEKLGLKGKDFIVNVILYGDSYLKRVPGDGGMPDES